jgi:hypothetical protein
MSSESKYQCTFCGEYHTAIECPPEQPASPVAQEPPQKGKCWDCDTPHVRESTCIEWEPV